MFADRLACFMVRLVAEQACAARCAWTRPWRSRLAVCPRQVSHPLCAVAASSHRAAVRIPGVNNLKCLEWCPVLGKQHLGDGDYE